MYRVKDVQAMQATGVNGSTACQLSSYSPRKCASKWVDYLKRSLINLSSVTKKLISPVIEKLKLL